MPRVDPWVVETQLLSAELAEWSRDNLTLDFELKASEMRLELPISPYMMAEVPD